MAVCADVLIDIIIRDVGKSYFCGNAATFL